MASSRRNLTRPFSLLARLNIERHHPIALRVVPRLAATLLLGHHVTACVALAAARFFFILFYGLPSEPLARDDQFGGGDKIVDLR